MSFDRATALTRIRTSSLVHHVDEFGQATLVLAPRAVDVDSRIERVVLPEQYAHALAALRRQLELLMKKFSGAGLRPALS